MNLNKKLKNWRTPMHKDMIPMIGCLIVIFLLLADAIIGQFTGDELSNNELFIGVATLVLFHIFYSRIGDRISEETEKYFKAQQDYLDLIDDEDEKTEQLNKENK
jgi:amino acid transporter